MNTYKTLEAARVAAKIKKGVEIARIEHRTEGDCYIVLLTSYSTICDMIKRKPVADIVRMSEGFAVLTPEEKQTEVETQKSTVKIHLTSCGWGDYSPAEWSGDIRKDNNTILDECKKIMENHDCDAIPSDDEIVSRIELSRAKINNPDPSASPAKKVEDRHGVGYCYNCGTYCFGDCGHYAPTASQQRISFVRPESDFGVND